MAEKDTELDEIRKRQEQIRITEEDQEKRLAEYERQLQADPKLRTDEDFLASMAQDALRGSKMSFQKEEEVTQEKSNEERIKELENMVRFLMKETRANV